MPPPGYAPPPPGQPAYPYGGYPQYPPRPSDTDGAMITSFIMFGVSMFLLLSSGLMCFPICIILNIVGIVAGHISHRNGNSTGLIAAILNYVGLAISLLLRALLVMLFTGEF